MLQQTRVAVAQAYYPRFLTRFPTLPSLAAASEAEVLALWSGLGYYRRARQMRRAAVAVASVGRSSLPEAFVELLALPGLGRYTAGAVLSIACQQPLPAVDGNILRVLSRLAGRALSAKEAESANSRWLDARRPGDSNQALMELGALICLPRSPHCGACPVRRYCRDQGQNPKLVARPRRAAETVRERYWLDVTGGRLRLHQRPADAPLLPGLWELPVRRRGQGAARRLGAVRHAITFRRIEAVVFAPVRRLGARTAVRADSVVRPCRWWTFADCRRLPLTGLTRKILRQFLPAAQIPS